MRSLFQKFYDRHFILFVTIKIRDACFLVKMLDMKLFHKNVEFVRDQVFQH